MCTRVFGASVWYLLNWHCGSQRCDGPLWYSPTYVQYSYLWHAFYAQHVNNDTQAFGTQTFEPAEAAEGDLDFWSEDFEPRVPLLNHPVRADSFVARDSPSSLRWNTDEPSSVADETRRPQITAKITLRTTADKITIMDMRAPVLIEVMFVSLKVETINSLGAPSSL